MSTPQVITLRVPNELKERVSKIAEQQGVSINQLINYFVAEKVSAIEVEEYFARRIEGKSEEEINAGFLATMAKVQDRPVPDWDKLPDGLKPISIDSGK